MVMVDPGEIQGSIYGDGHGGSMHGDGVISMVRAEFHGGIYYMVGEFQRPYMVNWTIHHSHPPSTIVTHHHHPPSG